MGGYNSGRYRTRTRGTVEERPRLDIRVMRRRGFLRPGCIVSGTQSWSRGGETTASVAVTVNLSDPAAGFVVVRFTLDGEPRVQQIDLAARPMRFGGRRYYFECPRLGDRCEVLPLLGGVFASRQAHRLAYQSQSEDRLGRLHRRSGKLEKRLHPTDRGPPRGRNRKRLVAALIAAEVARERLFDFEVRRRFGEHFP